MSNNRFYESLDAIEGHHSINLPLEASNTQSIQSDLFSPTLHLLVVLALEKKKKRHTVPVTLIGNKYLGDITFE